MANGNWWCVGAFAAAWREIGRLTMMNVKSAINCACPSCRVSPYWATLLTLENDSVTWVCWVVWGMN